MKHLLLVVLFVACALCVHAQQVSDTEVISCVVREGNTYWHQGQSMNTRAFRQFLLASGYLPAYECFQSGYRMAAAGWSVFGTGLGVGAMGIDFWCAGIGHLLFPPDDTVAGVMVGSAAMIVCTYLGIVSIIAGGVLDLVAIPLLCVGYARMHQSADVYNVRCTAPRQSASLGLLSGANGIGLALRF